MNIFLNLNNKSDLDLFNQNMETDAPLHRCNWENNQSEAACCCSHFEMEDDGENCAYLKAEGFKKFCELQPKLGDQLMSISSCK